MKKYDAIVLGGGITGVMAAWRMAQAGCEVLLLERNQVGAGASGCTASMLECQTDSYRGPIFRNIALPSLRLFPALQREIKEITGVDIEYEPCGILTLALSPGEASELENQVNDLQTMGQRARWLSDTEVEEEFPQLNPEYFGAALFQDDGQVNGEAFLLGAVESAKAAGVTFQANVGDIDFIMSVSHKSVSGVRVKETSYEANWIVVATGAWTDETLAPLGVRTGIRPLRGQLVYFDSPQPPLPTPVYTRRAFYMTSKSHYTLAGTTVEDVGFDTSSTELAQQELTHKARLFFPALKHSHVRGISAGLRPATLDTFPMIGPLMDYPNVLIAAGHFRNGILLAPITAEIVRDIVLKRPAPIDIRAYAPERFAMQLQA